MPLSKVTVLTEWYHRKIIRGYARKHEIEIERLPCHLCRIAFEIGEEIAVKHSHSRMKRNYYHVKCARRCNILD